SRGARRSRGALTFTSFLYLHSNNYCLRDKTKHEERQRKIVERLKPKVSGSIPLLCIGFQLHNFSLSDLSIRKEFTKPVYFNGSQFFGKQTSIILISKKK
ncbi:MAG: hypothetical protein M3156_08420, partial [Thermoproteota archaeon]|nr:hypothetical protein [Thermoproteota archaeon]